MRREVLIIVGFLLCFISWGQTTSDAQFFNAMNLDYYGLQEVKKHVLLNDFLSAKKELVRYLKNRSGSSWFFDWKALESEKQKIEIGLIEANRYAENELYSCGVWHKFGNSINWRYNPTVNQYKEWTWQLNRHNAWTSLGKAYWKTGDEKYAKAFVYQLKSWVKQCDCPNDDGNYLGSPWRTLEAGIRMRLNWPNAFYFFLSSPSFDDESIILMLKSFYEHAIFLKDNSISNYRLSHEMAGLYTVGALFPEFRDAPEWRTLAANKLFEEEVEQFYPDGSQKELSPLYHYTNLTCIVDVYRLAQLNHYQLPLEYSARLESIYDYYEKLMMPDGKLPAVNDSRWQESKYNLNRAAEIFNYRKDFLYTATRGERGRKPSYTSVWLPWAGCYVMRSGWNKDDLYAFFEVGPYGSGHQHEDKLSFILAAYGSRLITECGNYAYDGSQWRQYAISARGHNVVRVDGMDQCRSKLRNNSEICCSNKPLTNRWISSRTYDYGEGFYTEGFGESLDKTVTHHRSLKFIKNRYWLLTDEFIPSDRKEHYYDLWFHFNTDRYRIDSSNNVVYSDDLTESNIAIVRLSECHNLDIVVGAQYPEVQGWVSEEYADCGFSCRPVATPIYHSKGVGVVKEHFVFIPFPKGDKLIINSIKRLSSKKYRIYIDGKKSITVKL